MSIPRKHHYLPQFYLNGFKIDDSEVKNPQIWQIHKSKSGKANICAIKDTGCIKDFHTLDVDGKMDHQTVEKILSNIEGSQSTLLRDILKNGKICNEHLVPLCQFIISMKHRIPSFAAVIERILKINVENSINILYNAGQLPELPDELLQKNRLPIKAEIYNWIIIHYMLKMAFSTELIDILSKMKFQLLTAENKSFFITSDNPVALYHPDYDSSNPYGIGLASKGIELTFPLNKKMLIKASRDIESDFRVIDSDEVHEYNRRSMITSEYYIFSNVYNESFKKLLSDCYDKQAGTQYDNILTGKSAAFISKFIPVTKA